MIRAIPIGAFLAVAVFTAARGQQEQPRTLIEIGAEPGAVITTPVGSLESIRGSVPCSGEYSGTTRVNFGVMGWVTIPLADLRVDSGVTLLKALRIAGGYADISTQFDSPDGGYPAFDEGLGRYTTVTTHFRTDFTLRYFVAEAQLVAGLTHLLSLRLGASFGLPLEANALQTERIVSPATATFFDATQERTIVEGTGTLDDASLRIGIGAAIAYRMPLGRHLFFEPTIAADLAITNVQRTWSPLLTRLGIGIGYTVFEPAPELAATPPEPAQQAPALPAEEPTPFQGTVDISRVDDSTVSLRRHIVARYVPVIPVVFFDRNSASIPARYRTAGSARFTEWDIPPGADAAHLYVLDLLGRRLATSGKSGLTVVGTSGIDEADRDSLARQRAESVAGYLRDVWGIQASRIVVKSQLNPSVPSNSESPEGREENRRVEIEVNDNSLLDPVMLRSVEPVTQPESMEFSPVVSTSRPIASWKLALHDASGRTVAALGEGEPPTRIEWRLTQEDRERMLSGSGISYLLEVEDSDGARLLSPRREIPLRLDTTISVASAAGRPVTTAEFLLITFEFDQARLTQRGRRELETIASRIGPASNVEVIGYTDRLGEESHNLGLAADRARAVALLLPRGINIVARGASPDEAPYDNALPEGRFLNRTVRIVVTNPE